MPRPRLRATSSRVRLCAPGARAPSRPGPRPRCLGCHCCRFGSAAACAQQSAPHADARAILGRSPNCYGKESYDRSVQPRAFEAFLKVHIAANSALQIVRSAGMSLQLAAPEENIHCSAWQTTRRQLSSPSEDTGRSCSRLSVPHGRYRQACITCMSLMG